MNGLAPPARPFSAACEDLAAIMQRMTGASPLDIMNVRMIIEPQAAAAAASNACEPDIAGIMEAHEEAKKSLDIGSLRALGCGVPQADIFRHPKRVSHQPARHSERYPRQGAVA
jgi:DNA-binding FadR family transcriptional regulator